MGIFDNVKKRTTIYCYETDNGHHIAKRTIRREGDRLSDVTEYKPYTVEDKRRIERDTGKPLQKGRTNKRRRFFNKYNRKGGKR